MEVVTIVAAVVKTSSTILEIINVLIEAYRDVEDNRTTMESLGRRMSRIHSSLALYQSIPFGLSNIPKRVLQRVQEAVDDFSNSIGELQNIATSKKVELVMNAISPNDRSTQLEALENKMQHLEAELDTYGLLIDMRESQEQHAKELLHILRTYQLETDEKLRILISQLNLILSSSVRRAEPLQHSLVNSADVENFRTSITESEQEDLSTWETQTLDKLSEIPDENDLLEMLARAGASDDVKNTVLNSVRYLFHAFKVDKQDLTYSANDDGSRLTIGMGATAIVYKGKLQLRTPEGREEGKPRPVAVKVFKEGVDEMSSRGRTNMLRELYLQMTMAHPCVLRSYGMYWPKNHPSSSEAPRNPGQDVLFYLNDPPFMVMELMTHSLKYALQPGRPFPALQDEDSRLRVIFDVARGLQYLHERGVVHRDIKPGNVLIRVEDGAIVTSAKLCDFGISRKIDVQNGFSYTGEPTLFAGTTPYTPPEVLQRIQETLSRRSWDVWSFGILVCFIGSGGQKPLAFSKITFDGAQQKAKSGEWTKMARSWANDVSCRICKETALMCLNGEYKERPTMLMIVRHLAGEIGKLQSDFVLDGQAIFIDRIDDEFFLEGKRFEYGYFREKSVEKAIEKYKVGQTKKSIRCARSVAIWTLEGDFGQERDTQAAAILRSTEREGDLISSYMVSFCLFFGRAGPRNRISAGVKAEGFLSRSEALDRAETDAEMYERDEILFCRAECFRLGLGTMQDYGVAINLYKDLVGRRHIRGLVRLGHCYIEGLGVDKNAPHGRALLMESAKCGNVLGMQLLANCCYRGTGATVDYLQAVILLTSAAKKGDVWSRDRLVEIYHSDRTSPLGRQCEEWIHAVDVQGGIPAAEETETSRNNKTMAAQLALGKYFMSGIGPRSSPEKAALLFALAASQGCLESLTRLSHCFEHGHGISQNFDRAIEGYKEASRKGFEIARKGLANLLFFGRGEAKDQRKALDIYLEFAERGDMQARRAIGLCYERGIVLGPDLTKAYEMFACYDINGDAVAQRHLGRALILGKGVAADITKGLEMFRRSAEAGNIAAWRCLGACYEYGFGVDKDVSTALKYYHKAADNGDSKAATRLFRCYSKGLGVEKDDGKAREMLLLLKSLITWEFAGAMRGDPGLRLRQTSNTSSKGREARRSFLRTMITGLSNNGAKE